MFRTQRKPRGRLQKIVDETVEYARQGMEGFKQELSWRWERSAIGRKNTSRRAQLSTPRKGRWTYGETQQVQCTRVQDRRGWWRSRWCPVGDACNPKVCKRGGWSNQRAKHLATCQLSCNVTTSFERAIMHKLQEKIRSIASRPAQKVTWKNQSGASRTCPKLQD